MKSIAASVALLLCSFLALTSYTTAGRIQPRMFCPPDFTRIHDRCYYFSKVAKDWDDAMRYCQQLDPRAMLVNIETQREWKSIHTYIKEEKLSEVLWFIGGSDRDQEGKWTWVGSNEPFEFSAWCVGDPNNLNGNENCAILYKPDSCWADAPCSHSVKRFICEYE